MCVQPPNALPPESVNSGAQLEVLQILGTEALVVVLVCELFSPSQSCSPIDIFEPLLGAKHIPVCRLMGVRRKAQLAYALLLKMREIRVNVKEECEYFL